MEVAFRWLPAYLVNRSSFWTLLLFFWLHLAAHEYASANLDMNMGTYPAVFAFGDSLSDAGNAVLANGDWAERLTQWPYGMTFPGWPAGRYSDGHTLVDLLATYFGLPLLAPYLNSSADFRGGVNYAVGAATANNASFLNSIGIYPSTNFSLDVQVSWHLDLQATMESSKGDLPGSLTKTSFHEGLYVLLIGGDDYTYATLAGYPTSFIISTLMPLVIHKIRNAVETLLKFGAKHFLLVPITPLGCTPYLLTQIDGAKDKYGRLDEYNLASYLHGVRIKEEVENMRVEYSNASFLFMDYYAAYIYVLEHKEIFGYSNTLSACCGDEGFLYNFNGDNFCNIESSHVCANPSKYILWDGIHLTDSFNFQIFNQTFIIGTYLDIGLSLNPYHHVVTIEGQNG